MSGILYGVGVGPGDPELMTLKAVRILKTCSVVAVPVSGRAAGEAVAWQIAEAAVPEIKSKERLELKMPMTKDREILASSHQLAAAQVIAQLRADKDVAFLTLGDPTVYATYMYVHQLVAEAGYEAEIISGVPAFCAAAGKLGISLAEGDTPIHICPAVSGIGDALTLPGTKVLMKAGQKLEEITKALDEGQKAYAIENCGMAGERLWETGDGSLSPVLSKMGTENRPLSPSPGYFTTVIIKE